MKYFLKTIPILLTVLVLFIIAACGNSESTFEGQRKVLKEPFSFQELTTAQEIPIPPIETVEASDGIKLAYRAYTPKQPKAGVIFYHGGGAHSAAGYQYIGVILSENYNMATFTPDIRGHGSSEGPRGDAPNSEQVLKDISSFVKFIKKKYPNIPLYLGGHSSGAGLIVNYSSSAEKEDVEGYVFLAPQLGFRSKTEHENNPNPFDKVNTLAFIINGITKGALLGHSKAVKFNYSSEVLESDSGMVGYNTVNMANALTPSSPSEQLSQLTQPLGVWIGELDELLDANKVVSFVKNSYSSAYTEMVSGEKHLSILLEAADLIGPWIIANIKK